MALSGISRLFGSVGLMLVPVGALWMSSLWEDGFVPGIIGIEKYHYEPSGDAYNLYFEQCALAFGTREFVMYNPRDQQAMTSHKSDLLHLTPEQLTLEQSRGHYAVHDTPHPHWKYFWFD